MSAQPFAVILDMGGVLRDVRKAFWAAQLQAFEKRFGVLPNIFELTLELRFSREFGSASRFNSVLYSLFKSGVGEDFFEDAATLYDRLLALEKCYPISEDDAAALLTLWNSIYYSTEERHLKEIPPVKGGVAALELFQRKGYRLGAFTNAKRAFNSAWLDCWKLRDFFEVVLAREDVENMKPHPDGIHAVCGKMKISPKDAFYAGDSAKDVIAAKAAGCKSVFLLSGVGTKPIGDKEKPDLVCKSLLDFAEKITSIKNGE